ncbi:18879_t:CDS:2, partial [Racocetra persica]
KRVGSDREICILLQHGRGSFLPGFSPSALRRSEVALLQVMSVVRWCRPFWCFSSSLVSSIMVNSLRRWYRPFCSCRWSRPFMLLSSLMPPFWCFLRLGRPFGCFFIVTGVVQFGALFFDV